jgi:dTDP-4-amino-4,6-dideoxygalactose transaminase
MGRIYLSPPCMGASERELLLDAFDSGWIAPLGPHVDAFEREFAAYVGVGHAAALSSGTAALHLALALASVGPGDVVLTSALTFAATANPIRYLGAEPAFIDCERTSWNMDPALLAEELDARARAGVLPKAVVCVDLYGQCADYARITALCRDYDVTLIEDAAEALGARHGQRAAGSFGLAGVFSFNGNKIITTSGGGMLVSNSADLIQRARFLSTQARDPGPHYQHSALGYNYRMSNLLAAVGRGQLADMEARVARRREHNQFYRRALADVPGIELMPEAVYGTCTFWLTCILVDAAHFGADREAIRTRLEAHDIEARPVWKPMHLQPLYRDAYVRGGAVAEDLFTRGLCLPSGHALGHADRERIVELIRTTPDTATTKS